MKFPSRIVRPFLALFVAAFAIAGTATAADGAEAHRQNQNADCLLKMAPVMRPKVRAVLSDMESNGYKPIIDIGVWRTPADQMAKYRAGYSKVTYSFHNATTRAGKPDSLAADITDQRWGWANSVPRDYWMRQARSARVHALYSGSHFGLSTANKRALDAALDSRNFAYRGPLGWDEAHCEAAGITLGQAKAGKRPYAK